MEDNIKMYLHLQEQIVPGVVFMTLRREARSILSSLYAPYFVSSLKLNVVVY